jgi:hypothetical protein
MTHAAILSGNPASSLRQEYQYNQELYAIQPVILQHFLDQQARNIAQAIIDGSARIRFSLPDQVILPGSADPVTVPPADRDRSAGHWSIFAATDLRGALTQRLLEIEHSPVPALSISGSLLRFSIAQMMVNGMLPDGRQLRYRHFEGDEIPSLPQETDSHATQEDDPERLQAPYTVYTRRFFLPQWIAFDEADRLLLNSLPEAEASLASMQSFVNILQHAEAIAPYFVVDEAYQRKRTGILGQLVNQGRALARYEMGQLIQAILNRSADNSLNRGFSIDFTYFDERELVMKPYFMKVIPAGRIMFIPAFVVLAARKEYERIIRDESLNSPTRRHLLSLLAMLEKAFLVEKGI